MKVHRNNLSIQPGVTPHLQVPAGHIKGFEDFTMVYEGWLRIEDHYPLILIRKSSIHGRIINETGQQLKVLIARNNVTFYDQSCPDAVAQNRLTDDFRKHFVGDFAYTFFDDTGEPLECSGVILSYVRRLVK